MPVFEDDDQPSDDGDTSPLSPSFEAYLIGSRWNKIHDALKAPDEYMRTGWDRFDRFLVDGMDLEESEGGILRPSIAVLGAQPKAGKSMWVGTVGEKRAEAGDWVLHIDFENTAKRVMRRLLCRRIGVSVGVLRALFLGKDHARNVTITDEHRAKLAEALEWRAQTLDDRYLLCEDPELTPAKIDTMCSEMHAARPDRNIFIIIDSLQKLPSHSKRTQDRRTEINAWLKDFERIRNVHNAVILVVSELRRPSEGEKYKTGMTMFKESGGIEYTADLALLMRTVDDDRCVLEVVFGRDVNVGDVAIYRKQRPYFGIEELPLESGDVKEEKPLYDHAKMLAKLILDGSTYYSLVELSVLVGVQQGDLDSYLDDAVKWQYLLKGPNGGYVRKK